MKYVPSISTIDAFQKYGMLRKFCVNRGQKSMVVQIMREKGQHNVFIFASLLSPGIIFKQDENGYEI